MIHQKEIKREGAIANRVDEGGDKVEDSMFRCKTPCADLSVSTLTSIPFSINPKSKPPPPPEFALSTCQSFTDRWILCPSAQLLAQVVTTFGDLPGWGHLLAPEGAVPVLGCSCCIFWGRAQWAPSSWKCCSARAEPQGTQPGGRTPLRRHTSVDTHCH